MSSSQKKKSSREDSTSFETLCFSNTNASLSQNSHHVSQDSNSWMDDHPSPACTSETRVEKLKNTHSKAAVMKPSFESLKRCVRDPSFDIKDAGTGHHDNRLTKDPPGQFREPSLRRGYGMSYETPKAFKYVPAKVASKAVNHVPQTMESLAETEGQSSSSAPRGPLPNSQLSLLNKSNDGSNIYDLSQSQGRRGDLQPAGYRPIAMRPPGASERMATNERQGQSSSEKQTSKTVIDLGRYQKAGQEALLRACLEHKDLDKEMFRDEWKVVKGCVEKWCEPRKSQLVKDGTGASDSEIDTLIDQWNNVYATKFCSENKKLLEAAGWRKGAEECSTNSSAATPHNSRVSQGSAPQNEPLAKELDFEGVIWPTIKDELMKFAESKILSWVEDKLQERVQALDSLTRPPLLKANSSPESYQIYVRYLKNRIKAAGKNSTAIRDTEAVMSMALDLLPGLEERLRDQLEHVVDKKEDRPGAGIKYDHEEANDESENSHENSEEADHDIDHKVQEAQEDNHDGDELEARLEHNSEEDEDGDEDVDDFDDFEEFYADESEDDTYEDPDEPGRQYRGSVIDSIEPRTPIVTPRVMRQLRSYEQRYWDTIVVAKVETEVAAAVLRSVDKEEHEVASRKRKAPDSAEPALAIRSKSMEQRLAAVGTPTPTGRKRQKFSEASYSPASTTCSSELPSLEEIFSSSIGRASSATTQPPTNSSSPAVRVNKKKRGGKDRSRAQSRVSLELRDPTTGTATATAPSPGGMIGASPELGTRGASKDFVFEKSVSRHPILEERFREETAEFQAMTPSAREAMLYTALREMRRRQG
ncbi:uncharacterized protein FFNC_09379 [Fusarium fujikuroi]|nr:uncharacterized protein Y057_1644 [Fusarium fujikuroi]SCN91040.1 uncharacterized protein FFE2_07184 [Fusarium fujikuroi]SCO19646.1 uncharacterized protein FFC1_13641 [Fusarium fujikuroi]SCO43750.1 uncharacterized protein FFNC_09379 [Fusarium fujikuroi]SCV46865.1 uncharacterized protein FFFS_07945 [Fusarium fujikuroi]